MECVILYRLAGTVHAVLQTAPGEDDRIAVYPNMDAAISYTDTNKLFQSGQADWQIVELDQL